MTSSTQQTIGTYAKAVVSIIAAALVILGSALTDGHVTTVEAVNVCVAVVTAVGVYLVPNLGTGVASYAKGIVAFLGAALAALLAVIGDGGLSQVSASSWIMVLLAALGAIGVVVVPNVTSKAEVDLAA